MVNSPNSNKRSLAVLVLATVAAFCVGKVDCKPREEPSAPIASYHVGESSRLLDEEVSEGTAEGIQSYWANEFRRVQGDGRAEAEVFFDYVQNADDGTLLVDMSNYTHLPNGRRDRGATREGACREAHLQALYLAAEDLSPEERTGIVERMLNIEEYTAHFCDPRFSLRRHDTYVFRVETQIEGGEE